MSLLIIALLHLQTISPCLEIAQTDEQVCRSVKQFCSDVFIKTRLSCLNMKSPRVARVAGTQFSESKNVFMIDNHRTLDLAWWIRISFKHIIFFLKLKAEKDSCSILCCNANESKQILKEWVQRILVYLAKGWLLIDIFKHHYSSDCQSKDWRQTLITPISIVCILM